MAEPTAAPGPWRRVLGPGALLVLVAALYAPALGRGLVSEDFIILRLLAGGRFLETAVEQLTGPWLGVSFFAFYRPLGTAFLHLEWLLFGTWSTGYAVVHLAAHLGAVLLAGRVAHRLAVAAGAADATGQRAGLLVAALFGLGPLGPNTVSFIASFATLFSSLAALAAVLAFLAWRARPERSRLAWPAAGWTAVALGTYEGAVVLPALILAADLLLPASAAPASDATPRRRRHLGAHLLLWALLALYLMLRATALGSLIGGYPDLAGALAGGRLGELASRFASDLSRLVLPTWGAYHPAWLGGLIDAGLVAGSVAALARRQRPWARLWGLGLVWTYLAQLPFGTATIVPANGRYAYLATAGVGLLAAAAVMALFIARAPARQLRRALVAATLVVGAVYAGLLAVSIRAHVEAGARARAFRTQLVAAAAGRPLPILVAGEPDFVRHARGPFAGVPIAQIFHWGLADALMPPFEAVDHGVYPLPRFADSGLAPLLARGDGTLVRAGVRAGAGARLEAVALPIPSVPPVPGLTVRRAADAGELAFRVHGLPAGSRARAVIVARGHPDLTPARDSGEGEALVRLPKAVVETMGRLWRGPIYWWVEARDTTGAIVAASAAEALNPGADTGR